jgi:hypothetical protein
VNNVLNMAHRKVCPLGMQSTSDELQTLLPLSGQIMSGSSGQRFGVAMVGPPFVKKNKIGKRVDEPARNHEPV